MRWSAYAATLTPRQFTRVVNLLTTGYGYAYLAARAAERDGSSALVLARLRHARSQLGEALAILDGDHDNRVPSMLSSGDGHEGPTSASWRALLAARAADVAHAATLLADAAVNARRTADAVREDAEVEHIRQRLLATVASLTRVLEMSQLLLLLY